MLGRRSVLWPILEPGLKLLHWICNFHEPGVFSQCHARMPCGCPGNLKAASRKPLAVATSCNQCDQKWSSKTSTNCITSSSKPSANNGLHIRSRSLRPRTFPMKNCDGTSSRRQLQSLLRVRMFFGSFSLTKHIYIYLYTIVQAFEPATRHVRHEESSAGHVICRPIRCGHVTRTKAVIYNLPVMMYVT